MHTFSSMKKFLSINPIPSILSRRNYPNYNYVRSFNDLHTHEKPFLDDSNQRMPLSVQRSVRKQNIKYLHNRILFSQECFSFIKRLVQSNVQQLTNLLQQQQRIEDQVLFTNVIFFERITKRKINHSRPSKNWR